MEATLWQLALLLGLNALLLPQDAREKENMATSSSMVRWDMGLLLKFLLHFIYIFLYIWKDDFGISRYYTV